MSPDADYSRKWYVLAAVSMGVFLATIDGSIVNVALPTLVRELDTTFPVVQCVVLAYLLTLATLTLTVGRLGDMVGKKRIYLAGFVTFTACSVLAGLSPSVGWLIAFRVLQAVGASMVLSLGVAILTEAFPPTERGRALGLIGTMVSVGIITGPALGGILLEALSWHWIFFVNLPVGVAGTWMVARFVAPVRPTGRSRFDYAGAISLFVTLLALQLALTLGQTRGFASRPILLLFGLAVVGLGAFVRIELRTPVPMVELRLFRRSLLSLNVVTGFVSFVAIAGLFLLMPFYLENVLGFDSRTTGLLLAATPVALGVVAPISGWLSDRLGTRAITVAGLAILTVAYGAVRGLGTSTTAAAFVLTLLPIGAGMGVFQSPNNSAIMGSVPPEHTGIAGSLLTLTRILGQITGVAVLGSSWAARVAARVDPAFAGAATSAPPTAQVGALREVMAGVALAMLAATLLSAWGAWRARATRPAVAEGLG